MFRWFRRRSGRRGSPLPNIALGLLVLGAFTAATAAPPPEQGTAAPRLASVSTQPVVATVSPATGTAAGGTTVTITGTGFTGATGVTFNGSDATSFTVDSPTQITAVTPAGLAGPATVQVAVGTCVSPVSGGTFTYTPVVPPIVIPPLPLPPVASSVAPGTGPAAGGTAVTITGSYLSGVSGVTFGGAAATITASGATSITATTPAHAAGAVDVAVTTPFGTSTVTGGFTYTAPGPTITSFLPDWANVAGGATITVTGTNLTGTTAVTFGGVAGTDLTVLNSTTVTVTAPAHPIGFVDLALTTSQGTVTAANQFGYDEVAGAENAGKAGRADKADQAGRAGKAGRADQAGKKAGRTPALKKVFYQAPIPACPAPPDAPSPVTATAGTSSITVTWTAATPHVAPVTGYTVTASPGPATCTTLVTDPTPLSCVLGATAGQQYTVSVVANSALGASEPATSEPVIPSAPVPPTAPPDTPLTLTTDKGAINTAAPGQDIVVIGTGFAAHSTATITLYSTPLTLGTVVTDGNGDFSKSVTVPASLGSGVHTLVAQGVAPSGNPRAMKLTVTVAPRAAASSGGLAVTGAPAGPMALAGLAMLLTGAVLARPRVRFGRAAR
ncbi:IPT/TIG domain-containing protein [Dactylosporangium sp. CA-052675]|uniref:IPT/TIG domain-containing protein n=1 Tax=Dactylosporangium sp. CA-052675 TaxID=3239927 RepID=UPI003D8C6FB0